MFGPKPTNRDNRSRLRRRPLGRYRYVRLRWRIVFSAIDLLGSVAFSTARAVKGLVARTRFGRSRVVGEEPGDPRTILLVQLDHLGDAVISTIMFPALRRRYPRASIEVLAGPWNRAIFEAIPEVDRVHVCRASRFARRGQAGWIASTVWWGLWLRQRRVDLGIDVRGEFPHAVILWLSGARRRLGYDSGGGGFLLTDRPRFVADRPEVESRLALLAELGIEAAETGEHSRPVFDAPADARRRVAEWLADVEAGHGLAGPRIVLHVGAGTPAKRWPVEHWRALVGRLVGRLGARVVLVGDKGDGTISGAILGPGPRPGVVDATGRLRVVELAALLEQADVFAGADSGPAHLAAAAGTPTVVLFSGTNRLRQWRPWGGHVRVVRHAVQCSPCHRRSCPWRDHPCMRGIRPEDVAEAIERFWVEAGREGSGPGRGSRPGAKAQREEESVGFVRVRGENGGWRTRATRGCRRPATRGSEERVDKRGRAGAAQDDEDSDQQEHEDDRREPPLLVVGQEVEELGDQPSLRPAGLRLELLGFRVSIRFGWLGHGSVLAVKSSVAECAGRARVIVAVTLRVTMHITRSVMSTLVVASARVRRGNRGIRTVGSSGRRSGAPRAQPNTTRRRDRSGGPSDRAPTPASAGPWG